LRGCEVPSAGGITPARLLHREPRRAPTVLGTAYFVIPGEPWKDRQDGRVGRVQLSDRIAFVFKSKIDPEDADQPLPAGPGRRKLRKA